MKKSVGEEERDYAGRGRIGTALSGCFACEFQ